MKKFLTVVMSIVLATHHGFAEGSSSGELSSGSSSSYKSSSGSSYSDSDLLTWFILYLIIISVSLQLRKDEDE
jgi:hypothetical protein